MIVVDTSVWVEVRRDARIARVLDSLLDADEVAMALPVRLELWAGAARKDRRALDASLAALAQLVPDDETWRQMAAGIERAADAGERFAFVDMLIATLATGVGALVWSLDADFERMERVGLVSRYDPVLH
ncbi:MAG: PIN domain-containing protein [Vicinamibacterales bacterium]